MFLARYNEIKPAIERVQALADISRLALCCHSNETRGPIWNPPNSAQLEALLQFPKLTYPGPRSSVIWACGNGQTGAQTAVATIHFASSTTHTKCNYYIAHTVIVNNTIFHCTSSHMIQNTSFESDNLSKWGWLSDNWWKGCVWQKKVGKPVH